MSVCDTEFRERPRLLDFRDRDAFRIARDRAAVESGSVDKPEVFAVVVESVRRVELESGLLLPVRIHRHVARDVEKKQRIAACAASRDDGHDVRPDHLDGVRPAVAPAPRGDLVCSPVDHRPPPAARHHADLRPARERLRFRDIVHETALVPAGNARIVLRAPAPDIRAAGVVDVNRLLQLVAEDDLVRPLLRIEHNLPCIGHEQRRNVLRLDGTFRERRDKRYSQCNEWRISFCIHECSLLPRQRTKIISPLLSYGDARWTIHARRLPLASTRTPKQPSGASTLS